MKTVYECEYCGKQFTSTAAEDAWETCRQHESDHVKPNTREFCSIEFASESDVYPLTIVMAMTNGSSVAYIFSHVVSGAVEKEELPFD